MILLPMHGFYCIDFTHLQNLIGFIMQYKKIILLASSRKKLSVGMLDTTHTIGNIFFRILVSFEFHHWQQLLSDLWSDRLMSFIFEKMTAEYLRLNSYKFIKSSFKWKWCSFEGDGFSWAHNANVYTCTSRPLSFRAYFLWVSSPLCHTAWSSCVLRVWDDFIVWGDDSYWCIKDNRQGALFSLLGVCDLPWRVQYPELQFSATALICA